LSAPARPVLYGDQARWGLIHADALEMLTRLPERSVDAIVTDPPYGIDFREAWDGRDIRRAVRRHGERLSPGKAFARWTQSWAAEALRVLKPGGHMVAFGAPRTFHRLAGGVEDAGLEIRDVLLWMYAQGLPKSRRLPGGLATALKPAFEPVLLARRPLDGAVMENVKAWGTGALNLDAARVGGGGYWPAHVMFSHAPGCNAVCMADCPAGMIDVARPDLLPSRLFFCAKATRAEREAGCEQLPTRSVQIFTGKHRPPRNVRNLHPTVKPLSLMRWLVKLTVPPGGVVLDPFAGSASTGAAAMLEGRQFLGIERETEYVSVARARLTYWAREAG
jgi:DNA modification methylase